MTHQLLPILIVLFSVLGPPVHACASDASQTRRRALGAILADRQISDSALSVHRRAGKLTLEERYQFLADWVLPSADHTTFRLALDYSPTHPAPPVAGNDPDDLRRLERARQTGERRVQLGGQLVSPALDLIDAASQLGRLDQLRLRVDKASARGEVQERGRLALLILIDMRRKDYPQALSSFDQLYTRVEARVFDDFADRWPETLVVHESIVDPTMRKAVTELLFRIVQFQVHEGHAKGPEPWDRMVTMLVGRLTHEDLKGSVEQPEQIPDFATAPSLKLWSPVSHVTAWSRGRGMPCSHWQFDSGIVSNLASHDHDYLHYHIPLRGNFEVECDVSAFHWRDTHLMIAGTYVAPVYDLVSYGIGSFREPRPAGVIMPQLALCDEWIRYRAVVRNGVCTTYFNGRKIHDEPLPAEHDPWLAIRSPSYTDGNVREFRITGQPTIPRQIRLSVLKDLPGWTAYYGEPVGGENGKWMFARESNDGGGIQGRKQADFAGMGVESLLQYQRPMLEDGTIEYDFYYEQGATHVHPVLDRRAFILNPAGVRTHWMTDGDHDRTELSPVDEYDEPENRRGPNRLPLHPNAWNHLSVTLKGDTVHLSLNDELIYQVALEPTNQRRFGLFHWADRTAVHVRNVRWTGHWPRALPRPREQELAGEGTDALDDRLPQLTAIFEHDFVGHQPANDAASEVTVIGGNPNHYQLERSKAGLRVKLQASEGYHPMHLSPNISLEGDFDLTAKFVDFDAATTPGGSCGIYLWAILKDPATTHCAVYRGKLGRPEEPARSVIQSEFNRTGPNGRSIIWPGTTAEEASCGTLRLARRGNQVYALFAENDSIHYRLVHTETVPENAVRLDGLRLSVAISASDSQPCTAEITWTHLAVRAERITRVP